jgi:hypothetical protein
MQRVIKYGVNNEKPFPPPCRRSFRGQLFNTINANTSIWFFINMQMKRAIEITARSALVTHLRVNFQCASIPGALLLAHFSPFPALLIASSGI